MQLERPKSKIQRTYLQAVDAVTGKSRHLTVYDATPSQVIKLLKEAAAAKAAKAREVPSLAGA